MSFKENFERDDSKNDVQYDDSAFYTFGGTMLLCIMMPLLWSIYKRLTVKNELYDCNLQNCECSQCLEKIENLFNRKKKNSRNKTLYFMIFCFIGLCYLSFNCYFKIKENSDTFKTFDPFEILELPTDADERSIKKAYKKLALKYHPDRNPNNLQAKAKFMLLTKAYESLTDEVAKENFRKYGNPDGPESMRLAVGLPSFVLNKKNHMPILILFLIFIVVILPGFVLYWFNSTNSYDDAGVQVTNHKIFYEILNENILLRQMPFVLGSSMEFSYLAVRPDEVDELKKLYRKYSELMPKHKEENIPMGNKKAICLVYSHLDDSANLTTETLVNDLNNILEISPNLIYTMYQISRQYTFLKEMQEIQMKSMGMQLEQKMMIKNFGIGCIKVILDFSAIVLQKQNFKGSPLLQLPHFNDGIIKQNKSLLKLSRDLPGFCQLPNEEKLNLLNELEAFSKDEIDDIICASNSVPNYTIKSEVSVDGFEEILKDDYVTLKFTVKNGLIHSNKFPFFAQEKVAILLVNNGKIIHEAILDIDEKEVFLENKQLMSQAGEYKFKIELYSMNFRGLEIEKEIKFKVLANSEKRQEFLKKLEKGEPKKLENSFFQSMIQQMQNPDDDEEDEEEEEENEEDESEEEIETRRRNKASNAGKSRRQIRNDKVRKAINNTNKEPSNLDKEF